MKRKILYSPGFGAGWTTWNADDEVEKYMLTYQPIIDALERGEEMNDSHPAVLQLQKECLDKFGKEYVCVYGEKDLRVMEVNGLVRIEEYDGYESVIEQSASEGWM
jgi:hypothetical protein